MGKSPKFMVFHLRELIYTVIFVLLGIVLIISLIFMFCNKNQEKMKIKLLPENMKPECIPPVLL